MSTNRKIEIDILKAFAILAVVEIHLGGYFFPLFLPWGREWNSLVTLDQISRFSVPLFVALSGLMLAAKYRDRAVDLKDFYLHRATKILPLYFIWTLVSLGASWFPSGSTLFANPVSILPAIILGRADYHLYFVPMIFQFYLLFPLLLYLVKKFPAATLAFSFGWQIYSFAFLYPSGHWSDQEQYLFFGSWLFYFILGIFLSVEKPTKDTVGKLTRFLVPGILLVGLFLVVDDSFTVLRLPADLIIATRFTKVSVLLYATGVILTGIYWGKGLLLFPEAFQKTLAFIGKNSYLIYLSHVMIVRIIMEFIKPTGHPSLTLIPILLVVTALILSIILPRLSQRVGT